MRDLRTASQSLDAPVVNILIVDDSPANRLSLQSIIAEFGQNVVVVATGEEAIRRVHEEDFAAILLDVSLPGISGFQTAESIRASPSARNTPIVFVTAGEVNRSDLEHGYTLGAVDFLTKPLLPIAVQAKVNFFVTLFEEKRTTQGEAEQLRLLIQSTVDYAIFVLDPQGHVVTWNTGAERLKGYSAEEIIGQHFRKFYPQEMLDRKWPEHELQVAAIAGRFEDEGWRVRKDGTRFWGNVVITALRDELGRLRGFSKITRDMTERKKAEENAQRMAEETTALRVLASHSRIVDEQRERLRVTLASIGDAVLVTDTKGVIVNMNPVAEELTGWTSATATGVPLEEVFRIVNETTRNTVENPAAKALREGVIVGLANHTVLIAKDGAERPIDDSAAPIKTKDGELVGCVLVFRDVSERRRAEKALYESELRYRLVGQAANDAIWDWDLITNKVFWNEGVKRVFGYGTNQIGANADWWTENIHPEDRARITEDIHHAIDHGADTWQNSYRFRRVDDTYALVIDRGHIVRQEATPVRMVGSMLDITERTRAEDALRTAEERFAFVRKSSGVGFWYCDLPFDVLQWDDQVKSHFHLPSNAAVTIDTFYNRIHPEDRDPTRTAIEKNIAEGIPYDIVYRTVHATTNAEKWIRAIGRTTYDASGRPIRFDGVTIDVSKQKETESQLRNVAAALSEAGHRKDEFLATLAHELRNPLAPISNSLQLLRLTTDQDIQAHARNVMDRQLSLMVRLVDDLMDISRITRGKVDLQKSLVALAVVISSAIETSRPAIEGMNHKLEVVLPPEPLMVEADHARLTQVFSNLLNNAAKYSEPNSCITLTGHQEDGEAVVIVKDVGIGIAEDQLSLIFDMFMQVDRSLSRSQGGLGIGLTLVKRLVEMHGGEVSAKSAGQGKGAEFTVRLPLVTSASQSQEGVTQHSSALHRSRRILIVDDNQDGADSLALMLKHLGNETRTANDGEAGVRLAQDFRPDVILFDIGMPKLNGLEACARIRQQPWGKTILMIALTGWGQEQDRRRSHEAGFDHHLIKPVDSRTLLQILSLKDQDAR